MAKIKALMTVASDEQLAILRQEFPAEQGFKRTQLPRLGMFAQDKFEGVGKAKKVVAEAGMFFIEKETDEENEKGGKVWAKEEIGTEIDVTIIFQRKTLKYYDEKNETFTASSVYDTDDEIIPLWANKAEIDRGTPAELKARPQYQFEKDGKIKSKLGDNRILYVIYEGELHQMNLRGSSMYSWMSYQRSCNPSAVITHLSSTAEAKGSIAWNKMSFDKVRDITGIEATSVIEKVTEIKDAIVQEKAFFATQNTASEKAKGNLEKF